MKSLPETLAIPRDVVGTHGPPGTTLFDILDGNPKWKDFLRSISINAKYHEFHHKLENMTPRDIAVDSLHQATAKLDHLVVTFYPLIGVGGIMAAVFDVGGAAMMKSIGHFVGQRVASIITLPGSADCGAPAGNDQGGGGEASRVKGSGNATATNKEHVFTSRAECNSSRHDLRDTLAVLATHTNTWRAAIHGVMWGVVQRLNLTNTPPATWPPSFDAAAAAAAAVAGQQRGAGQGREEWVGGVYRGFEAHRLWDFALSEDACGAYVARNPFFFTSCLHGFGHGAHLMHRYDLAAGLDLCQAIAHRPLHLPPPPLTPWTANASSTFSAVPSSPFSGLETELAGQCATGVFMEYDDLVSAGFYSKPQRPGKNSGAKKSKDAGTGGEEAEAVLVAMSRGLTAQKCAAMAVAAPPPHRPSPQQQQQQRGGVTHRNEAGDGQGGGGGGRAVARACFFRLFSSGSVLRRLGLTRLDLAHFKQQQQQQQQRAAPRRREGRGEKRFALRASDFCSEGGRRDQWSRPVHPQSSMHSAHGGTRNTEALVPAASAASAAARGDCMYGFAKALYDPSRDKLRDLCSFSTTSPPSASSSSPSPYLSSSFSTTSSSSSQISSMLKKEAQETGYGGGGGGKHWGGGDEEAGWVAGARRGADEPLSAMCVYGAMTMTARLLETTANPQPRAPPEAMAALRAACVSEWRPPPPRLRRRRQTGDRNQQGEEEEEEEEDHLVTRLVRACVVGGESLNSRAALANIAWCEECDSTAKSKSTVDFHPVDPADPSQSFSVSPKSPLPYPFSSSSSALSAPLRHWYVGASPIKEGGARHSQNRSFFPSSLNGSASRESSLRASGGNFGSTGSSSSSSSSGSSKLDGVIGGATQQQQQQWQWQNEGGGLEIQGSGGVGALVARLRSHPSHDSPPSPPSLSSPSSSPLFEHSSRPLDVLVLTVLRLLALVGVVALCLLAKAIVQSRQHRGGNASFGHRQGLVSASRRRLKLTQQVKGGEGDDDDEEYDAGEDDVSTDDDDDDDDDLTEKNRLLQGPNLALR